MKTIIRDLISVGVLCATPAICPAVDIYLTNVGGQDWSSGTVQWNHSNLWAASPEATSKFGTYPKTENDNVSINQSYIKTALKTSVNDYNFITLPSSYTIGNLSFENADNANGSCSMISLSATATSSTFTVAGDLSINRSNTSSDQRYRTYVEAGGGAAFNLSVGGSVNITKSDGAASMAASFGNGYATRRIDEMNIGLNLNVAADTWATFNVEKLNIAGVAYIDGNVYLSERANSSTQASTAAMDNTVTVGALIGKGGFIGGSYTDINSYEITEATTTHTTINILTVGSASFSGRITDTMKGGSSIIKIVKSGEGVQDLIMVGESGIRGGIEVIGGTLRLYTESSAWQQNSITLKGGTLCVSANPDSADSYAHIYAKDLAWSGGSDAKINIGKLEKRYTGSNALAAIQLAGNLTKASDEKLYYFSFTDPTEAVSGTPYMLISFSDIDPGLTADSFRDNSSDFNMKSIYTITDNAVFVTFAPIPEPSAAAAIIGALVLGFAMLHGRRGGKKA